MIASSKFTALGALGPLQRQRGITLVIALIMLALLTLFVLGLSSMTNLNLRAMGNMQARSESIAAAQQAIEQVATTDFPKDPQPVSVTVDINGDGTTDYTIAVAKPACLNIVSINYTELSTDLVAHPEDLTCYASGAAPVAGIVPSGATGASLCSSTLWDVNATVTDNNGSNAAVTVHQGIARRVNVGEVTC